MSLSREQLRMRRTLIGASDAAVIAGVSPYSRTVHDLWLSKSPDPEPEDVPQLAGDAEQTEAQLLGHELEPVALGLLARHRRLQLTACQETRRHPRLSFIGATPDALVGPTPSAPDALAEAKAPGMHYMRHWGPSGDPDGVPDYVVVQNAMQAVVWDVPLVHVVALLGNEPRFFVYERNTRLENGLLDLLSDWWEQYVVARVPPPIDASAGAARMLQALYPHNRPGALIRADADTEELARQYFEAERAEDEAKTRRLLAENQLKARIGDCDGITGDGWRAQWMSEQGRVSWKAVAEALGATESLAAAHRGPSNRKFKCTPYRRSS